MPAKRYPVAWILITALMANCGLMLRGFFGFPAVVTADERNGLVSQPLPSSETAAQTFIRDFDRPTIHTRLRISWGGDAARRWRGTIKFTGAKIDNPAILGFNLDSANAIHVQSDTVRIEQRAATSYEGFDIDVIGGMDSSVELSFAIDETQESIHQVFSLEQLVTGDQIFALDQNNNRCSIVRAPGDWIPFRTGREHLIFDPNEDFWFEFRANQMASSHDGWICDIEIVSARTGDAVQPRRRVTLTESQDGHSSWITESLAVPGTEGVYNLRFTISPADNSPLRIMRKQALARREVQFVVLDRSQSQRMNLLQPRLLGQWTPSQIQSSRTNPLNSIYRAAGWSRGPTVYGEFEVENGTAVRLPVGGWQMLSLSVTDVGQPHLIEIDYRVLEPMSLGISILQGDSVDQIPNFGFDSGLHIDNITLLGDSSSQTELQTRRIMFWPSSNEVSLLIANRHAARDGRYETIRHYRADRAEEPTTDSSHPLETAGRRYWVFYEQPTFAENFEVPNVIDDTLEQPLIDWITYYEGARRLVEYLHQTGARGALINVLGEGSALMPLQSFQGSSRLDSGIFSTQGHDPIRKDVVELLFRIFEREQLQLVPVLSFDRPLAALEFHSDAQARASMQVVDYRQNPLPRSKYYPAYNPLCPLVQQQVEVVVREIGARYGHHSTYQGLAINCSPATYCMLPGSLVSGYDDYTLGRFSQSHPGTETTNWNPLTPENYSRWLHWRSEQMSQWYHRLQSAVSVKREQAKLYLPLVDIFRNEEIAGFLAPSLHRTADIGQAMMLLGFTPELAQDSQKIVLMQPRQISPGEPLASRKTEFATEHSQKFNQWFLQTDYHTHLFLQRASWQRLDYLLEQSMFARQDSPIIRQQPLTPAGAWNRERYAQALLRSDARMMVDGGLQMDVALDDSLKSFLDVYSGLPDVPFETIPHTTHADELHPVAVRSVNHRGTSYVYCVNGSPWEAQVNWSLTSRIGANWVPVGPSPSFDFQLDSDGLVGSMQVTLPPFQVAAIKMIDQEMQINSFSYALPDTAQRDLNQSYYKLRSRLVASANAGPLDTLMDAGFEQDDLHAAWTIGDAFHQSFEIDSQVVFQGKGSLKIDHQGAESIWIRSHQIPLPITGRLSVSAWLRTDNERQQPPLRICIESSDPKSSYYRFAEVGSLTTDRKQNQLSTQWKRIAVHFDDLPRNLDGLRVGFDMMGTGRVWIDQIQLYDRWMDQNDLKALTQMFASLGPAIRQTEKMEQCRQILNGYWPTFLREYFDEESASVAVAPPITLEPGPASVRASMRQRFRRKVSPGTLPFR